MRDVDGKSAAARETGCFGGKVAIVVDDQRSVIGIVTKMDLIEMLAARKNQMP